MERDGRHNKTPLSIIIVLRLERGVNEATLLQGYPTPGCGANVNRLRPDEPPEALLFKIQGRTRRSAVERSLFNTPKGGKATVFVQDFDLAETDLSQQVELEQQRAGSVLLGNVGKDLIAVGLVFEAG